MSRHDIIQRIVQNTFWTVVLLGGFILAHAIASIPALILK